MYYCDIIHGNNLWLFLSTIFVTYINIFVPGILGLTGLYGFAFYVFAVLILWVMFMIKAGPNWHKYYVSRQSLLTNGFFGALFTYVLFWTFIYGMVHVY